MTIKNRVELEASFKNGKRPSETHFQALIASMLNKRDDQFHGRWKGGVAYRTGDVVVHDHTLWEMTGGTSDGSSEICSDEPPNPNSKNWGSLVIPIKDDDWFLAPIDAVVPGGDMGEDESPPEVMYANPRVLGVGIGTDAPVASLDVRDGHGSSLRFGACERPGPVLRLVHHNGEEAQGYLAAWVERCASFVTDAPGGFAFHDGGPHQDFRESAGGEKGVPLVSIKQDGRVGIGTDEPGTRLEVANKKSGRFLFNLDRKVNPALGIVNTCPGSRENYLTTGVDNDVAVFVTDSDYGFLFRAGGESGSHDHEIDINQGKELVSILPQGKGKLGVGRKPDDYQLDVDGIGRSFGCYVDTDESKLSAVEPLRQVLDRLCELRPVSFAWSPDTGVDDPGRKFGLVAHEVEDVFPEVVHTNRDRTKAVAYHALVPVLIEALQEQKSTIDRLEWRLDELEKRVAARESPPEPKL